MNHEKALEAATATPELFDGYADGGGREYVPDYAGIVKAYLTTRTDECDIHDWGCEMVTEAGRHAGALLIDFEEET